MTCIQYTKKDQYVTKTANDSVHNMACPNFLPEIYEETTAFYIPRHKIQEKIIQLCTCNAFKENEVFIFHGEKCLAGFLEIENMNLANVYSYLSEEFGLDFYNRLKQEAKENAFAATTPIHVRNLVKDCRRIVLFIKFCKAERKTLLNRFTVMASLKNPAKTARARIKYLRDENTSIIELINVNRQLLMGLKSKEMPKEKSRKKAKLDKN